MDFRQDDFELPFADHIFADYISQILEEGVWADPEFARPHYVDGMVANFKYLTDVTMKFDLQKKQFPISTLRPIAVGKAIEEVLWIYQDQNSSLETLEKRGVMWWREWDNGDNTIGERYGKTVQNYDIVNRTLQMLEENPYNRRSIMNLWQYKDLDIPAKLPPCAFETMFDVRKIGNTMFLDCHLNQRSSDFLVAGLGINQMQYVALQLMFANHLGMQPGTFSWHIQNLHIYDRHLDQAQELLKRAKNYSQHFADIPKIDFALNKQLKTNFYEFTAADFELIGYDSIKPQLKFELAI